MENPPLIDDFPMNTSASTGFPASHVRVPKDTNWERKAGLFDRAKGRAKKQSKMIHGEVVLG